MCPPGTSGPDGGPCSACAAGTYKNATGDAACDACSSTTTSVPGSSSCFCKANFTTTADGQCLPCMDGMISWENSTFCFFVCGMGYTGTEGKCVGCEPGTYKDTKGDATCNACGNKTFSRAAAAQCSACPLSATAKQNHTSCACNPGFAFLNNTCTQTQGVYVNISGTLQMPDGTLTESQLQAILLDDISTYLNVSRDFITVIVLPAMYTSTNTTAPANTTTARRLLSTLPVEYAFTVLFQIPSGAYAQLEKFVSDVKSAAAIITDSTRYRLALRRAKLSEGYFDSSGRVQEPCPDGQQRIVDNVTATLVCPPNRPTPAPTPAPTSDWGVLVGLLAALLLFGLAVYGFSIRSRLQSKSTERIQSNQTASTASTAAPSTVSIEYHRVPLHLI
jgi:hypothetical protein